MRAFVGLFGKGLVGCWLDGVHKPFERAFVGGLGRTLEGLGGALVKDLVQTWVGGLGGALVKGLVQTWVGGLGGALVMPDFPLGFFERGSSEFGESSETPRQGLETWFCFRFKGFVPDM